PPLRTCPLRRRAVEMKVFVGLGSGFAFRVEVAVRGLLSHPVFPAVMAGDLRADAGMEKLPLLSVTADPALYATVTPAAGEQSIALLTLPEIVPAALATPGLRYGTTNWL